MRFNVQSELYRHFTSVTVQLDRDRALDRLALLMPRPPPPRRQSVAQPAPAVNPQPVTRRRATGVQGANRRGIVLAADQPNAEINNAIIDDGRCCSIELI